MTELEEWVRHGNELQRPLLINQDLSKNQTIFIIGGGLSGMCAAYRLGKTFPLKKVVLIEKSNRLGGVIQTWKRDEWLCDISVNASRAHPAMWRLIEELGLSSRWSPSNTKAKSRWIWLNDSKHKLSFLSMLKIGPFKTLRAIKRSKQGGKSVAEVLPHLGIADAMTLGIVNDESSMVDADFLFPTITQFGPQPPIKNRTLTKKMSKTYPLFSPRKGSVASLDGGMEVLIDTLQSRLEALVNVEVRYDTHFKSPDLASKVLATPLSSIVWAAPGMIENFDQTTLSIFVLGYREEDVHNVPIGYGLLIPDKTVPMSGILHESDLHAWRRAPSGHRLFRIMVPHARWDLDEQTIRKAAERFLGTQQPVLFEKIGVRQIPTFSPGHLQRMVEKKRDCSFIGWSYSGVSITHVVDEIERMIEEIS